MNLNDSDSAPNADHDADRQADRDADPATQVTTLANGVRVVTLEMPWLESASVSVFVRAGSRNEDARIGGVSHFVEHMAFKGTETRDGRQVNVDAERLGAEVNAHTDKDHTAYHLRGRAADAVSFVEMLGDIVLHGTYPADELERERQVILQEFVEDDDDPMSIAFRQFDRCCYGAQPFAQPVLGTRASIEALTRDDLLGYVRRHYTGANLIVGAAGRIDAPAVRRAAEVAFGAVPAGTVNVVPAPVWQGGIRLRRIADAQQSHLVLGYPLPGHNANDPAGLVAAALLGEGMSSPLMHEIREKRGLVYYAACSADVVDDCGEFVIEASTAPEHLEPVLAEVRRLLVAHAGAVAPEDLARARNQIAVRRLRALERPWKRLEDAALDLYEFGHVRAPAQLAARVDAVTPEAVRAAFARMLARPVALAVAGTIRRSHGLAAKLAAQFAVV